MEKQRYSLRTNIGYFLNKASGYSRDFHVEYSEIFIDPDLNIFNFVCDYRFSRTREGLLLQAQISGEIDAECVRCLVVSRKPFEVSFEELFLFAERSEDEGDLLIPSDGYIELGEVFRDYILLSFPIKYVCSPDCKGICVTCGQNLNLGDCEHTDSRIQLPDEEI